MILLQVTYKRVGRRKHRRCSVGRADGAKHRDPRVEELCVCEKMSKFYFRNLAGADFRSRLDAWRGENLMIRQLSDDGVNLDFVIANEAGNLPHRTSLPR